MDKKEEEVDEVHHVCVYSEVVCTCVQYSQSSLFQGRAVVHKNSTYS